jgi:hypothetical protein
MLHIAEVHELDRTLSCGGDIAHALHARIHADELVASQKGLHRFALRHESERAVHRRVSSRWGAINQHVAGGGSKQTRGHVQDCGLARPVRTEERSDTCGEPE